jgi:hypothetical protein
MMTLSRRSSYLLSDCRQKRRRYVQPRNECIVHRIHSKKRFVAKINYKLQKVQVLNVSVFRVVCDICCCRHCEHHTQ